MDSRVSLAFQQFDQAELRLCRYLNLSSGVVLVRRFFALISWLGDGKFWYGTLAVLPVVYGSWQASIHAAATAAIGVLVYKLIKERAVRERPFITHAAITCTAAPLDRYSFPSGHTLHAVAFTWMICSYYPAWAPCLVAFTLFVALSRVILGLHYLTDVAAGAAIGAGLAIMSLLILAPV